MADYLLYCSEIEQGTSINIENNIDAYTGAHRRTQHTDTHTVHKTDKQSQRHPHKLASPTSVFVINYSRLRNESTALIKVLPCQK